MSDLEQIKAMFDRAGIVYEENPDRDEEAAMTLCIEQGLGPKNDGYYGFITIMFFDESGTLLKMGAWE